jgi:hypothetical protein
MVQQVEILILSDFEDRYRKWHTYMSYVKSAIRIVAFAGLALSMTDARVTATLLLIAETVGIAEEWV